MAATLSAIATRLCRVAMTHAAMTMIHRHVAFGNSHVVMTPAAMTMAQRHVTFLDRHVVQDARSYGRELWIWVEGERSMMY